MKSFEEKNEGITCTMNDGPERHRAAKPHSNARSRVIHRYTCGHAARFTLYMYEYNIQPVKVKKVGPTRSHVTSQASS